MEVLGVPGCRGSSGAVWWRQERWINYFSYVNCFVNRHWNSPNTFLCVFLFLQQLVWDHSAFTIAMERHYKMWGARATRNLNIRWPSIHPNIYELLGFECIITISLSINHISFFSPSCDTVSFLICSLHINCWIWLIKDIPFYSYNGWWWSTVG